MTDMVIAYVLINVRRGCEEEVLERLAAMDEVKEAYLTYSHNIIVEVAAESIEKVKEVVFWKIRRLENVLSTTTLIVMKEVKDV